MSVFLKQDAPAKGFTLIETLVAIAIVLLSIVGPLIVADRTLVAAQLSRYQLTASYLAQEGVEYVRAMRDDAYLAEYYAPASSVAPGSTVSATAWNNFLTSTDAYSVAQCTAHTCTLDPTQSMGSALTPCGSGTAASCTPLYLANGLYTQQSTVTGAQETPYTRTVQVLTTGASYDVQVVSTVTWDFHGVQYSEKTTDQLTAWQ